MRAFRFSKMALLAPILPLGIGLCLIAAESAAAAPAENLQQVCRQAGNDDTVRPYSHDLYKGTVEAFRKLAPDAKAAPSESDLETQAQYRCMNGKTMVCFIGANLPCVKMDANRDNAGADAYCKDAKSSDFVPAAATGHDTIYSYRCRNGKPEITDTSWELDERGFARKLWAELPDH